MDECIIETLSYFDIFDYPLTFSEIKKYLCCEIDCSDDEFLEAIQSIPIIQESNGFFYFLGRNSISEKRMERAEISIRKYARATIIAHLLSLIPTIEYIGVSGSLSMNNASLTDDIDLFFITKSNTLWISRFLVNTLLYITKQKRQRTGDEVKDKICPNMFLEAGKLQTPEKRKTLYNAHEIIQLRTLFDRHDFNSLLLSKNKWINVFFPNISVPNVKSKKLGTKVRFLNKLIIPIENIVFNFQRAYMKNHRSSETVTKSRALFHPVDRQKLILEMFLVRSKRYKSLHIDNFWVDRDEARFYMEDKKIRILN